MRRMASPTMATQYRVRGVVPRGYGRVARSEDVDVGITVDVARKAKRGVLQWQENERREHRGLFRPRVRERPARRNGKRCNVSGMKRIEVNVNAMSYEGQVQW